jgi:alpha-tubulin suppressor-like RCC1 family protein
MRRELWLTGICALLALSGCGDTNTIYRCPPGEDAGLPGGEVKKKIGAAGGVVELPGGAKVQVPKDALDQEIEITVKELSDPKPFKGKLEAAGKAYSFEPHGTQFKAEVTISVPFEGEPKQVTLAKLDDDKDESWAEVENTKEVTDATRVSTKTKSFSVYCAARPRPTDAGPVEGDGGADPDAGLQMDGGPSDPCELDPVSCDPGTLSQLAAGSTHACARYSSGLVYCWGDNSHGNGGQGVATSVLAPGRVVTSSTAVLTGVAMIAANPGGDHTCAVRNDGSVWCWGKNDQGQCGADAPANQAPRAYLVPDVSGAVAVGVGASHSCAVTGAGAVRCWGYNTSGQLGTGDNVNSASAQTMLQVDSQTPPSSPIADAIGVFGGRTHTCVLHAGRQKLSCVGSNDAGGGWVGLLGRTGAGAPLAEAVNLPVGTTVRDVAIGSGFYASHTCVLPETGRPICWGTNTYLQLASAGGSVSSPTPLDAYYTQPSKVALGSDFTCVAYVNTVSGPRVACQGTNGSGQLGDSTTGAASDGIPDDVGTSMARTSFLGEVELLVTGRSYACAKLVDNGVTCWGDNANQVYGNTAPARSFSDISQLVSGLP